MAELRIMTGGEEGGGSGFEVGVGGEEDGGAWSEEDGSVGAGDENFDKGRADGT